MSRDMGAESRWEAAGRGASLVHWRTGDLAEVACAVQQVWTDWARDWGLHLDASACCALATPSDCAAPLRQLGGAGTRMAWRIGEPSSRIARELFGPFSSDTGVAVQVGRQCESDVWSRTSEALGLRAWKDGNPEPAAPTASRWSGAVVLSLAFGARVLLSASTMEGVLRRGTPSRPAAASRHRLPPLASVRDAVSAVPFRLDVQLDGCELEFGALRDLQVGDVLRIRHALDRPASVRSDAGTTLFHGFLARSRGRKAIELSPCLEASSSARGIS